MTRSGRSRATRPATRSAGLGSVLPHMEQMGVYRAFDFRHGPGDPENRTVLTTRISCLICPNEGVGWSFYSRPSVASNPFATGSTSYAGCHNDVEAPIDTDNHGVFYLNSRVRFVDVSDGLSNTIFVGEMPRPSTQGWMFGTRATLRNTGHPINLTTRSALEQALPAGSVPARDGQHDGPGAAHRFGKSASRDHLRGRLRQHASRRRRQLRVRRRLRAVPQADDRPGGLPAAGPPVRRGADR